MIFEILHKAENRSRIAAEVRSHAQIMLRPFEAAKVSAGVVPYVSPLVKRVALGDHMDIGTCRHGAKRSWLRMSVNFEAGTRPINGQLFCR